MNFIKLNHQHSFTGIDRGEIVVDYGSIIDDEYRGIRYHEIRNESMYASAFEVIPERYRADFFLIELLANWPLPPHTDSGILITINFYITTGNYFTNFYKVKDNVEARSYKAHSQTDGSIFFEDELDLEDSFYAEPTDIYLLNVKVPHSVSYDENTDFSAWRTALALQSNIHDYSAVVEMLKETNSI